MVRTLGICKWGWWNPTTVNLNNWEAVTKSDVQGEVEVVFSRYIENKTLTDGNEPFYLFEAISDYAGILSHVPGSLLPGEAYLNNCVEGFDYTISSTYRDDANFISAYSAEALDNVKRKYPNFLMGGISGVITDNNKYIIYKDYVLTDSYLFYKNKCVAWGTSLLSNAVVAETGNSVSDIMQANVLKWGNAIFYSYSTVQHVYGYLNDQSSWNHNVFRSATFYSISSQIPAATSRTNFINFLNQESKSVEIDDLDSYNEDPYAIDGTAGTGGGTGDVDNTSDPIDFPTVPAIDAVDTGLVSLFCPSLAGIKSLGSYLWSGAFDVNTFKKIFADPMDCIIGLSIFPVALTGPASSLYVGNQNTGLSFPKLGSQWVDVDCGTLNVKEFIGSYLDYSPYTKIEIYLPFIGVRPLNPDDVMSKSIELKYRIDLMSGGCVAYLKVNNSIIYTYEGQCSASVPITSAQYGNIIQSALSIAGSIGSLTATGGASAPSDFGNIASNITNVVKPDIQKSGAYSGSGALLGVMTPYLIISRPRPAIPANQNKYQGYPAMITRTLSNVSGYTEVEDIRLNNVRAMDQEKDEIRRLLHSGVIL